MSNVEEIAALNSESPDHGGDLRDAVAAIVWSGKHNLRIASMDTADQIMTLIADQLDAWDEDTGPGCAEGCLSNASVRIRP